VGEACQVVDELHPLLLRARAGDRLALAAFIRRTQADVWRLCAHLAGPEEADDLTQEVYVRAWTALPAWRGAASARTWLLAIARRACADTLRAARRRRLLGARLRPPADVPDPAGEVALHALLATLRPDRRVAFVLTQLLGLSYAEAAQVCGCPVGTVRSRVARARTDLIDQLAGQTAKHA